jgi:hypothetical protein
MERILNIENYRPGPVKIQKLDGEGKFYSTCFPPLVLVFLFQQTAIS